MYLQLLPLRGEGGSLPDNLRILPDTRLRKENEISWFDGTPEHRSLVWLLNYYLSDNPSQFDNSEMLKAPADRGL